MGVFNVIHDIREAIGAGRLKEPFSPAGFADACPRFDKYTHAAFLHRHAKTRGRTAQFFERVSPGFFRLLSQDVQKGAK